MDNQAAIDHLEEVLAEGTQFNLGEYISEGFEIWKKYAGGFIGFIFVSMVISVILTFIPFIGPLANFLIVSPALALGAYFVSDEVYRTQSSEFGHFFDGFKFVSELVVAQLIIGIAFGAMFMIMGGYAFISMDLSDVDFETFDNFNFAWWMIVPAALMIYFGVLVYYVNCFIGFYGLKAVQAITYSVKFINNHWLMFFVFLIIIGFLAALGMIAFFIGIFVTMSFIYPMIYASFNDLTKLDEFLMEQDEEAGQMVEFD